MTGKSDPLSGGFVSQSQLDGPFEPPTPEQQRAAAITIVEHSTSLDDARELLDLVGLR